MTMIASYRSDMPVRLPALEIGLSACMTRLRGGSGLPDTREHSQRRRQRQKRWHASCEPPTQATMHLFSTQVRALCLASAQMFAHACMPQTLRLLPDITRATLKQVQEQGRWVLG